LAGISTSSENARSISEVTETQRRQLLIRQTKNSEFSEVLRIFGESERAGSPLLAQVGNTPLIYRMFFVNPRCLVVGPLLAERGQGAGSSTGMQTWQLEGNIDDQE
jgi:hypothetical protein